MNRSRVGRSAPRHQSPRRKPPLARNFHELQVFARDDLFQHSADTATVETELDVALIRRHGTLLGVDFAIQFDFQGVTIL